MSEADKQKHLDELRAKAAQYDTRNGLEKAWDGMTDGIGGSMSGVTAGISKTLGGSETVTELLPGGAGIAAGAGVWYATRNWFKSIPLVGDVLSIVLGGVAGIVTHSALKMRTDTGRTPGSRPQDITKLIREEKATFSPADKTGVLLKPQSHIVPLAKTETTTPPGITWPEIIELEIDDQKTQGRLTTKTDKARGAYTQWEENMRALNGYFAQYSGAHDANIKNLESRGFSKQEALALLPTPPKTPPLIEKTGVDGVSDTLNTHGLTMFGAEKWNAWTVTEKLGHLQNKVQELDNEFKNAVAAGLVKVPGVTFGSVATGFFYNLIEDPLGDDRVESFRLKIKSFSKKVKDKTARGADCEKLADDWVKFVESGYVPKEEKPYHEKYIALLRAKGIQLQLQEFDVDVHQPNRMKLEAFTGKFDTVTMTAKTGGQSTIYQGLALPHYNEAAAIFVDQMTRFDEKKVAVMPGRVKLVDDQGKEVSHKYGLLVKDARHYDGRHADTAPMSMLMVEVREGKHVVTGVKFQLGGRFGNAFFGLKPEEQVVIDGDFAGLDSLVHTMNESAKGNKGYDPKHWVEKRERLVALQAAKQDAAAKALGNYTQMRAKIEKELQAAGGVLGFARSNTHPSEPDKGEDIVLIKDFSNKDAPRLMVIKGKLDAKHKMVVTQAKSMPMPEDMAKGWDFALAKDGWLDCQVTAGGPQTVDLGKLGESIVILKKITQGSSASARAGGSQWLMETDKVAMGMHGQVRPAQDGGAPLPVGVLAGEQGETAVVAV